MRRVLHLRRLLSRWWAQDQAWLLALLVLSPLVLSDLGLLRVMSGVMMLEVDRLRTAVWSAGSLAGRFSFCRVGPRSE